MTLHQHEGHEQAADPADAFGTYQENVFGDEWLMIVDIESVVAGLRSAGATCVEDDELVMAAYNGRERK